MLMSSSLFTSLRIPRLPPLLFFCFALCSSAHAAIFVVNNTAHSRSGSLRDAVTYANAHSGTTIHFRIPRTDAGFQKGVFTIKLLTPLPAISANQTIIDGNTQAVYAGDTNPDGPEIEISGANITDTRTAFGLTINAAHCVIRNLAINRFDDGQILISGQEARENIVQGCYIATDVRGSHALSHSYPRGSVTIRGGASNNLIGGSTPAARNIITTVNIQESGTRGNRVCGNLIGVARSGRRPLSRGTSGGVLISQGAEENVVGGERVGEGNLIAGQTDSIGIKGKGTDKNRVQGNFIGTTIEGDKPFFGSMNYEGGVDISDGASYNIIGGATSITRNVISEFNGPCIWIRGAGTRSNQVQGNYIGIGADGQSPLSSSSGVSIQDGATRTVVGGSGPGQGNVISGSTGSGIAIWGGETQADEGQVIQGNLIGTDATGTRAVSNKGGGVAIMYSSGNIIGGSTPGAGNVISGNKYAGISIYDKGSDRNIVQGNFIGVDKSGTHALGNGTAGIWLGGVRENLIGGSEPNEGNVISSNGWCGVFLFYTGCEANHIEGNFIGTDLTSTLALGNGDKLEPNGLVALNEQKVMKGGGAGVICLEAADNNFIGGSRPGAGNVIAHNFGDGIRVQEDTFGNAIRCNSFFENRGIAVDLHKKYDDDSTPTQNDWTDSDSDGGNHLQNYPKLIIENIQYSGDSVILQLSGSLHSAGVTSYGIDLFLCPQTPKEAAQKEESKTRGVQDYHFIGSCNVVTNEQGEAKFAFNLTVNAQLYRKTPCVSASATDQKTEDSSEVGRNAAMWPANKIIFVNSQVETSPLCAVNPDGTGLQHILDSGLAGNTRCYAVSTDCSKALIVKSDQGDRPRISVWRMRLDESDRVNLTPQNESEAPGISGNGHVIAFIDNHGTKENPSAKWRLYVMRDDGTYLIDEKNDIAAQGFGISLSYDGKSIVFCNWVPDQGGYQYEIFRVDLDGTHLQRLTTAPGSDVFPAISSDGKLITWQAQRNGSRGIYLMNADGSHQRQLTEFGSAPCFSPDGKQIVFSGDDGVHEGLFIINADGGDLRYIPNSAGAGFPTWLADAPKLSQP
jgi:Tol biopolymer transport system component